MPRKPPPPHPKGAPRTPGSGRKKGTPNRKTVEMRGLMAALVDDIEYQHKLREDFRHRRIHPSIESLVWAHVVGKPKDRLEVTAEVTLNEKLAAERELLRHLSLPELEALAAESQALVDKALAIVRSKASETTTSSMPPSPDTTRDLSVGPTAEPDGRKGA
jgi:hypothetical protein